MATPTLPLTSAPTIKIAEDLHPAARTESTRFRSAARAETSSLAGGVFHQRSLSRSSIERRSLSRASRDRRADVGGDGEDGDDFRDDEIRRKQVFRGRTLLWLAYQSIGVIYGDIGTSPLYVFSSTFTSAPSYEGLVEVLSVVIWSLTLVVTIKYVIIILHADNEGEGGTFSCYSLLTRYANIASRDPREEQLVRMERHLSQNLKPSNRGIRTAIEKSPFTRGLLKTIGVLAVSMVMSDGVLTPAQSVLGAVQGLAVVKPDISSATVVGTSCGILVLLFLIQPFGTAKLASAFAPIVIVWLGFNGAFGIYNLVKFDHSVLKAFSPYFAIHFFVQGKTEAWRMLGGILLAFTGVEALFADLGAFSMRAIQLSWLCWAYPCLLLAYIGQAAYISMHPAAYSNPFFNSVPPGMLYPSLVVAVMAAIVASQAIITATFQLISQIMKLSYCPQVKVVHTSKTFHGQLYVPFLNWLLMCGTILVTAVFSNTTRLGNAYGVCVMFVTFFDTCMVTLVALIVWRLPPYVVFVPWLTFACVDGLYISSALTKVPDGAWLTLTISGVLACLSLLWRFGKENQWRAEAEDRFRPSSLVARDGAGQLRLAARWGGDRLSNIRGLGVFFDKTGALTPLVVTQFVSKFVAVTDVVVFFHLHPVETPSVPDGERYIVSRIGAIPGCYRLVIRHGFMDEVISPDLGALVYEQLRAHIIRQAAAARDNGEASVAGVGSGAVDDDSDKQTLAVKPRDDEKGSCLSTSDNNGGMSTSATTTSADLTRTTTREREKKAATPPTLSEKSPMELRDEAVAAELARLDRAYAAKIMYVVGKEQMRIRDGTRLFRRLLLETFLWIRDNTRAKVANLRLAMERVVEVGFVKEI
ncbi:Potassium transporter 5 [Pleurostoma richardsiae]|uniref:Potassium transporter 5 n=1 Tax=Pleurostoma richardsiae TaxID=41990 RepID=A0AA38VHL2_9PEZI|nr:Potassium transporter 5 [Pleurostoma richardsiae]